jgi:hypothetical protein
MNSSERRTIEELVARYMLEPSLRDIYVEGVFDQDIAERCIRQTGQKDRIVYHIDTVDVPRELLEAEGLTNGNKQRLIALAKSLARVQTGASLKCLVDRDFDHWFGDLDTCPYLFWTRYCSLELYFFSEKILQEILIDVTKARIENFGVFITSLIDLLRSLYIMRLADKDLSWKMNWLALDKHLSQANSAIAFEKSEYISRLLQKNSRARFGPAFDTALSKWDQRVTGDHRCFIRGHDFIEALRWTISSFHGVKELASCKAIERILVLYSSQIPDLVELFA